MKIKINCVICKTEFKVNRGSHIITCPQCRSKTNTLSNWKARNKMITNKINTEFDIIRVYHGGGEYKIALDNKYFNLKNSITRVCDKKYYRQFIKDNIKLLENDLEKLKKYEFR